MTLLEGRKSTITFLKDQHSKGCVMIEPETVFGKWTIVKRVQKPKGLTGTAAYYLCRCECGKESIVTGNALRSGHSTACKSCGYSRVGILDHNYKHGHTHIGGKVNHSTTYKTWASMKQRCLNPKHPKYEYYGGRGITVCDRWKDSFINFLSDMGERPLDMTIDRIENDGNYELGNCQWADAITQANNRSVI